VLDALEVPDSSGALEISKMLDVSEALDISGELGSTTTPDSVHGSPSRGQSSRLRGSMAEFGIIGVDVLNDSEVRTARRVKRSVMAII
jgi:hypothetical protein